MADAFRLRWKLDKPFLHVSRADDLHVLVVIEPNTAAQSEIHGSTLPAHLIVVVDVSGSMDILMRHDPSATAVGAQDTEGKPAVSVVSEVPSRREVAGLVVRRLIEGLRPDDRLTLVAFDDVARLLALALGPHQRAELREALRQLGVAGGGGTLAAPALDLVRQHLQAQPDSRRACKLLLISDGEDEQPDRVRSAVAALAAEARLPLVAFGMGECKVAFLAELARATLAGGFHHLRDDRDADQLFQQAALSQKNVIATNVQLRLWLSPDLHVNELYRTRPEILYVGDLQPDTSNVVTLPLEQLERGKAYEFLFRCLAPRRADGQRFRLAKAMLVYDLPGLNQVGLTQETNIVVEYTASEELARQRSGDVRRVLARAEVQRQILFLQSKIDAFRAGAAGPADAELVAKLLAGLIQRLHELGDTATANQYRALQAEFLEAGTISQEMLNRSLAASSRAEDVIVALDVDF